MDPIKILNDEPSIVPLTIRHNFTSFQSSDEDLNDFLKNDAKCDQDEMISRTYLCCLKNRIIGFFTIVADTIDVQAINDDDSIDGYPYRKYPCVKIARLAVDKHFERKGIGRFLVLAAIGLSLSVSDIIGCRYLTVDSKPNSLTFYERLGFKIVEKYKHSDFPKMYVDMNPIIKAIQLKEPL